ncbi:hypothetical protein K4A83_21145 [Spirulina subsalsa FACHB-351]|uniref:Uncharacterized protein n=1 Tax=Spirulina subsalsa FACHB-351 TaxID=234711 RepID=A0ABT3LB89_9CYAN|nr:hypothetical protein [Spirulina subsalsa]MCW6038756.1 hypothetical protein [Spirulina subsalsa FACHB-351]
MPKAKTSPKPVEINNLLTGANVVIAGIAWSFFTVLFFLLFSITPPGQESPFWYLIGTYILETFPFILASVLCYRNWKSPQIASGSSVWFFIFLGITAFTLGNIIFGIWELYFGLDPEISPADLFYVAFTVCLGWGMVLAVLPRRVNLDPKQWGVIVLVAIVGIAFAVWLSVSTAQNVEVDGETETVETIEGEGVAAPTPSAPAIAPEAEENPYDKVPSWVKAADDFLAVFSRPVNLFYAIADVGLMIIAATLLLAFWGGRFSQSWRMIAAAALAKYVADMWFKYATTLSEPYESGGLLEVFYVFSGVLFAMGAALEYDVSTSRHSRSRRRRGRS